MGHLPARTRLNRCSISPTAGLPADYRRDTGNRRVTLGVREVSRAQEFYEAFGWRIGRGGDDDTDQIAFFQAGGLVFALWDRAKLEQDSGVEDRAAGEA